MLLYRTVFLSSFIQAEVEAEIENQPAGWRHEADGRVDAETNRAMIRENVEASNKEDSVRLLISV